VCAHAARSSTRVRQARCPSATAPQRACERQSQGGEEAFYTPEREVADEQRERTVSSPPACEVSGSAPVQCQQTSSGVRQERAGSGTQRKARKVVSDGVRASAEQAVAGGKSGVLRRLTRAARLPPPARPRKPRVAARHGGRARPAEGGE